MRKLIILLLSLLISGCISPPESLRDEIQSVPVFSSTPISSSVPVSSSAALRVSDFTPAKAYEKKADPKVYKRKKNMTVEEVVEDYIEQQYLSYTTLTNIDLSSIIDMRSKDNKNMVRWTKMLTRRRKLIAKNDFCYVETKKHSYTISFEKEPSDRRTEIWKKFLADPQNAVVHFRIKGEAGKVYPPIMAMNTQHSILLKKVDGEWKISMHYFPGSRRKYAIGTVKVPTEAEMLADLKLEFKQRTQTKPVQIPPGALEYDAKAAANYAKKYTEIKNPKFCDIGDWTGNCANFVSQSVWTGFGAAKMTNEWHDGSSAWNHVGYFWKYIKSGKELGGQELRGVSEIKIGDIIQTRSMSMEDEPDRFTHELMVVDEKTLKLAQNTPAAFVYYSDLVNTQTRIIRPTYLR